LAISSSGGHWAQLLRLSEAFEGHDVVFATTQRDCSSQVPGHRFHVIPDATRWNKARLVLLFLRVISIVVAEKPDVVISTGAAPGCFALYVGRCLGAKTIWLESLANVRKYSLSTKLVKPVAGLYLTQWHHMSRPEGPYYKGSLL